MRNPNGFSANDSRDEKNTGNGEVQGPRNTLKRVGGKVMNSFRALSERGNGNHEVQSPKRVFGRIGDRIGDFVRSQEEKKHERRVLASIHEIEKMARGDGEGNQDDWDWFVAKGAVDFSDDRVLDALLNMNTKFDESQLSDLMQLGVSMERIMKNEHMRALALSHFESLFETGDSDGTRQLSSGEKLLSAVSSSKVLPFMLEEIIRDDDARARIEKRIGNDAIQRCGDEICEKLALKYSNGYDSVGENEGDKDLDVYRRGIGLLRQLGGYDYFTKDNEEKKTEKVSCLLGSDSMCRALNALGFMDGDIVCAMYDIKAKKMAEYVERGLSDTEKMYAIQGSFDYLQRVYAIPDWLEPNENDEEAQYWREQSMKCGFDAMVLVADMVRKSEGEIVWSDGIRPDDSLFEAIGRHTPLGRMQCGSYDSKELTFFANNVERIKDDNLRGLIKNWSKIQCETAEQTEKARSQFLEYMREGQFSDETGQNEKAMLFDENGNPTAAFFKYERIYEYMPKEFLPFIDKNWRKHYSDAQLATFDYAEEYPNTAQFLKRSLYYSIDEWPDVLKKAPEAYRGLASLAETLDIEMISVPGDVFQNITKYFDENGPKREFVIKCLMTGQLSLLEANSEEMIEKANLDDISKQFLAALIKNRAPLVFPLNSSNIITALTRFIEKDAVDWKDASDEDLKIREAFNNNDVKDLALKKLRKAYGRYLVSKEGTEFPIGLHALSKFVRRKNGAGPLVQVEALLDFISVFESTGKEGKKLTAAIEDKMQKERWTNQDKTNFYAVSTDVIQASPEIYQVFASLFVNLEDREEFEIFTKEIYPLYRAKLALLRKHDDNSDGMGHGSSAANYKDVKMKALKDQLHQALSPFNLRELPPDEHRKAIDIVRNNFLEEVMELFQSKLGIANGAVPEKFSKADIRAIEDMTLYLSNISLGRIGEYPKNHSKNFIGLFLALQFGEASGWNGLRRGEEIDLSRYLAVPDDEIAAMQKALQTSRENDPINQESTGIADSERFREFRVALEHETSFTYVGSTVTVDQRLQSLMDGVEGLMNPDIYPDEMDKKRIEILKRYSVRDIGTVAAKMWRRASGYEGIVFSDSEKTILDELTVFMNDYDKAMTPENIKRYLQVGFDGVKMPFIIWQIARDENADKAISELRQLLKPTEDVVRIFEKLGETIQPNSGVLAVGVYLDYLRNLIVKYENKLSEAEKAIANDYIAAITMQMNKLEGIFDAVVETFNKKKGMTRSIESEQLQEKLTDVGRIIESSGRQAPFVARCTGDLPMIIENMRQCLSAKTKGINNDTNLTFGEGYQFYLYSNDGSTKGSTSDQIVYFVPMEHDGGQRMCFVLDQLYGLKNDDVYIGHIETVIKKANELKKQFPEVPISIFIPNTTKELTDEMKVRIRLPKGATIQEAPNRVFSIPKSGLGDHYVEFGGDEPRKVGKLTVSGIEIVL